MRSYEQLAQAGYEAFRKSQIGKDHEAVVPTWDQLWDADREAWLAAARQIVAEHAALH